MSTELMVNKPSPIEVGKSIDLFDRNTDVEKTINSLEAGNQVLLTGFYNNGLMLTKALQLHLSKKMKNKSFLEQGTYRSAFQKLSNLILIEIEDHKINLKKAPAVGWLEKLYPDSKKFTLTFPQVQGLNSSWQWYKNGIAIPVLRNKIHPYYGTYFPTRFDHLILFDNWLKRYTGPKKSAMDVGVGSGVLSYSLVKHGFQKVFGTDTNPNAIIGMTQFMGDTKLSRKIELDHGHLFGKWEKQSELIVFNPPWLPALKGSAGNDEAINYNETLFPEFFAEAKKRLLPDGKLLIIFSNLAQITHVTDEHPIEQELADGGRFVLEKCWKKKVKAASGKTKRDQHWRSSEEVELWVLTHK